MSEDQDRWNRDQLGKAMDLIDQVAFKRINGLDVGLARTMCNMKRRLRQIDRKMEGDRRTKIQKERDASAAARVTMSGSGAAGLPAVKIPEGKGKVVREAAERLGVPVVDLEDKWMDDLGGAREREPGDRS